MDQSIHTLQLQKFISSIDRFMRIFIFYYRFEHLAKVISHVQNK